jgi:hypothetical protein
MKKTTAKKLTKTTAAKKQSDQKPATQTKALSTTVVNAEADAGAGQEEMKRDDYAIPRLTILQDLSPQVKKTEEGYIKGAEAGMICDALNERIFDGDNGIAVIPVSYRRAHIEWKPRKSGGGFVKDHGSDPAILQQVTRDPDSGLVFKNGNTLSIVGEYFVFLLDKEGGFSPYVLSMSGSQQKKSRRWNTMINQLRVPAQGGGTFNPAMFYMTYRLSTVPERNDQGSWFGWKIQPETPTLELDNGDQVYVAAREFRNQINKGDVKVAAPSQGHDTTTTESDDKPM